MSMDPFLCGVNDYGDNFELTFPLIKILSLIFLWRSLLMIALYHQTKTPISFWCKRGLNPKSLIQPSETLPVELTETHTIIY